MLYFDKLIFSKTEIIVPDRVERIERDLDGYIDGRAEYTYKILDKYYPYPHVGNIQIWYRSDMDHPAMASLKLTLWNRIKFNLVHDRYILLRGDRKEKIISHLLVTAISIVVTLFVVCPLTHKESKPISSGTQQSPKNPSVDSVTNQ